MGFDWLEHDREDLSGEAANTANNGGTYYYVIWNQWQEDEHENVSESDAIFRRIMYLDNVDAAPSSSILYTSHTAAGYDTDLVLIGSAVDNDHLGDGIVDYQWRSDRDGVLSNSKELRIPASSLSTGLHTLLFCAQDAEGNWSKEASVTVFIAETLHQVRLPYIIH